MSPVRILLVGAEGKMGKAIEDEARDSQAGLKIVHRCQRDDAIADQIHRCRCGH